MKTQKEIEKEIKELTKENHTKYYDDSYGYNIEIDNDKKIEDLKILLQQNKEFIEMIDILLFEPKESLNRLEKIRSSKKSWTKELIEEYKQLKKEKIEDEIIISILQQLKSSIIGSEEKK